MRDRFYLDDTPGGVELLPSSNRVLDQLKTNSFSEIIPHSSFRGIRTGVVRVINEKVEDMSRDFWQIETRAGK